LSSATILGLLTQLFVYWHGTLSIDTTLCLLTRHIVYWHGTVYIHGTLSIDNFDKTFLSIDLTRHFVYWHDNNYSVGTSNHRPAFITTGSKKARKVNWVWFFAQKIITVCKYKINHPFFVKESSLKMKSAYYGPR